MTTIIIIIYYWYYLYKKSAMFWTNPEFCKWCNTLSRITGGCTTLFLGATYPPVCWGCCHVHLVKTITPPIHFPPPKRCEKGTGISKYREGAEWRAGLPDTGHHLQPCEGGGGPRPFLPLLSSCVSFWPPALDPFSLSREQLLWPQAAPICPAFAQGHSLAELGFPLALPQHTLTCSFPAIAGSATLCLCQQPALAPGKGCWARWKFLEGQKHRLSSRLFLMGGRNLTHGQGETLAMAGLFQFLRGAPQVLGKQMAG